MISGGSPRRLSQEVVPGGCPWRLSQEAVPGGCPFNKGGRQIVGNKGMLKLKACKPPHPPPADIINLGSNLQTLFPCQPHYPGRSAVVYHTFLSWQQFGNFISHTILTELCSVSYIRILAAISKLYSPACHTLMAEALYILYICTYLGRNLLTLFHFLPIILPEAM